MKRILKIVTLILVVLIGLVLIFKISGNGYLIKGVWATYMHGHNSATIDDARFFKTSEVEAASASTDWVLHPEYNKKALPSALDNILKETESVAFLMIQNDTIIREHYWDGYNENSESNSFSMAKSITTMLCQIAIQKGVFTGWEQKVNTFLPALTGAHASELELWHLSTMSSGLNWNEQYTNPFNVTAKAYYGEDIKKLMLSLPIDYEPGKSYHYQSGSTQLLGMCLSAATGKTLSFLASEWLWKPLQAKRSAQWSTDDSGTELAYCCFNSNARDFARFGKMMLHHGQWNGTPILDSSFVAMATSPKFVEYYGYSFWLDETHGTKIFYQRGILGQYIICIPEYHLVVVRLGHKRLASVANKHSQDFHVIVEEVLKMVKG